MKLIFEPARGRLFLLGLFTGGMSFIPPLNLVAPVFSALAFIHLCLAELQRLRAGEREIVGEVLPAGRGKEDPGLGGLGTQALRLQEILSLSPVSCPGLHPFVNCGGSLPPPDADRKSGG